MATPRPWNARNVGSTTELSTGRMDQRVGVGSRFCRIFAGRVGSTKSDPWTTLFDSIFAIKQDMNSSLLTHNIAWMAWSQSSRLEHGKQLTKSVLMFVLSLSKKSYWSGPWQTTRHFCQHCGLRAVWNSCWYKYRGIKIKIQIQNRFHHHYSSSTHSKFIGTCPLQILQNINTSHKHSKNYTGFLSNKESTTKPFFSHTKTLTNQQPTYLYNSLSFPSHSVSTRSSDSLVLSIPYVRSSLGKRAFSVIGPRLWNSLTPDTRNSSSLPIFRSRLKTHLFKIAFPP